MSDRAYRLLLWMLPGWFREEFGREMLQAFRDSRRPTDGGLSTLRLLLVNARDIAGLAVHLHADALTQDTIYALRTLRQTPAFTLAAIGTLAVGLGPTLVIANLLYQVLLSPLPFPESEQLVRVWNARPDRSQSRIGLSVPDYMDFRARQTPFEAFAAHAGTSVAMTLGGASRQVTGVLTTSDLHDVLRVRPVLGRRLEEPDMAPGAPPVSFSGRRSGDPSSAPARTSSGRLFRSTAVPPPSSASCRKALTSHQDLPVSGSP